MTLPKGTSLFYRESKKRWVLSYADPVRGQPQKVLPKEITRQRDAEIWAREWLNTQGLRPDATLTQRREQGPTVAECSEKWLALRERDSRVAPATLKNNRQHLKNWILPRFGSTPLAALEVPKLRAWLREIRELRAALTVRNIYYTFSTFYADAMAEGWVRGEANILEHPGVQSEIPDAEDDEREAMCLPLAWAQALIQSPRVALEWRARYALAFTSGARDGEIAGLRWLDIEADEEIPIFRIKQAVAIIGAKGKGGFAKPKEPKTKKSKRTLPLHPAALAALTEWRGRWAELVGRSPTAEDYVFPGPDGKPSRPRSASQIREDLARLELPTEIQGRTVEFRATRSSFASWLNEAGVSQGLIKRLMGHATRDITEKHYTARDLEQLARAVEVLPFSWEATGEGEGQPEGEGEPESEGEGSAPASGEASETSETSEASAPRSPASTPRSAAPRTLRSDPRSGTRPFLMTGGTRNGANSAKSLAPPRRLERPTNGLGMPKRGHNPAVSRGFSHDRSADDTQMTARKCAKEHDADDSATKRSSPRALLSAQLTNGMHAAIEAGDIEAARLAHEALGKLLGGVGGGAVVDLAAERARRA